MKDESVPNFSTHAQKASYLKSREQKERIAGNRNILFALGIKAAKRYYKRLAKDPDFAKRVVALANE